MAILQDTNAERASAPFAASLHNQNVTPLPSAVDASPQFPSSSVTMMHDIIHSHHLPTEMTEVISGSDHDA